MSPDQDRKEELRVNIKRVHTIVLASMENGLFDGKSEIAEVIFEKLRSASASLEKTDPSFSICQYYLDEAISEYINTVNFRGWRWRFLNVYAMHIWILLIGYLSIIFVAYLFFIQCNDITGLCDITGSYGLFLNHGGKLQLPQNAVYAVIWGAIGGLLQGIYRLWQHVSDRVYRKPWIIFFISTPVIGGLLGAIVYFLLAAGLLILTQNAGQLNSDKNTFVVIAAAGYAGYRWESALNWFKRVGQMFTTQTKAHNE